MTTPSHSRIIFITDCALDIEFGPSGPTGASPAGLALNAAMTLARGGYSVAVVGEAGCDPAGNMIVDALGRAGVDTQCIDRFPDGATALRVNYATGEAGSAPHTEIYRRQPQERLVLRWPRISRGDVVVFGGYFALDGRTCGAVSELVRSAIESGARVAGLPGYDASLEPAITHVMPQILENLECSAMVFTLTDQLAHLFGSGDAARVFSRNVSFYTPLMVNADTASHTVTVLDERSGAVAFTCDASTAPHDILACLLAILADTHPDAPPSFIASTIQNPDSWKAIR